jgi:hypothetical protein
MSVSHRKRSATHDLMGCQSTVSSLVPSVDPMIPDYPFSHGYLCSASSKGFKLRLTTRLRDCLASEKYSVLATQVENFFNICEADVLPVHHEHLTEDGTNPHVPSWEFGNFESFRKLYDPANYKLLE